MDQKIIVNSERLTQNYLPEKLLHRNKERNQLLANLQNFINTFITGSFGSGKSALAKRAIIDFNSSKKGYACYIDCSIYQTTYSILKEILPRSEFILYRSNYELIKELLKQARERKFAVCLDNFEKLKEKDLIARFMSLGLCVILISDNEESFALLSENIRSNIPSIIGLPAYTVDQSFDILKDRAEKALAKWTYSDVVIKKIAEKIKGNISLGINALKLAALKAERENKKAIEEADIPEINVDCPKVKLSRDEKVLLRILKEWKSLPASRLYDFYVQISRHPKSKRSFRNYMERLCSKGLAKAIGEKRGRIYEIVEDGEDVFSKS
jgi:Cdc6-like AAA superfamily ATPase